MAGNVVSWIFSMVRNLTASSARDQIEPATPNADKALQQPTPDPGCLQTAPPSLIVTSRGFRSSSPHLSPDLYLFPEHGHTPQLKADTRASMVATGRFGSRLDIARQTAVTRAHAAPVEDVSSGPTAYKEQVNDEIDEQVQQQIQREVYMRADHTTIIARQSLSSTPDLEPDDDSEEFLPEVSKPTYMLTWRVGEANEITRAALAMCSTDHAGTTRTLLHVAKAKTSRKTPNTLVSPACHTNDKPGSNANTADRTAATSPPPPPSPDQSLGKKRKPMSALANSGMKRLKATGGMIQSAAQNEVEKRDEDPRPTRRAAKLANKATKSALWREALHDDTYIRRAENVQGRSRRGKN